MIDISVFGRCPPTLAEFLDEGYDADQYVGVANAILKASGDEPLYVEWLVRFSWECGDVQLVSVFARDKFRAISFAREKANIYGWSSMNVEAFRKI